MSLHGRTETDSIRLRSTLRRLSRFEGADIAASASTRSARFGLIGLEVWSHNRNASPHCRESTAADESRRLRSHQTPATESHQALPEGGPRRLRTPPRRYAANPAAGATGLSGHAASCRHRARRMGHCRQGRRSPTARLGARPAQLQGPRDLRPWRAREIAALPPAFLEAPAAARPYRSVRPFLVRARPG